MCQRHIGGLVGGNGKRHSDDACRHVIKAGGLGVKGELTGLLQALQPGIQLRLGEHRLVVRSGNRRRRGIGRFAALPRFIVQFFQQPCEFEVGIKLTQLIDIRGLHLQVLWPAIQIQVATDRGQLARQRQPVEVLAQALTDLALDVAGMRHNVIQRAMISQPPGRRFRPDLGNTRDVIGAITRQRQEIYDLFRGHAELLLDPGTVEGGTRHGIDQRHMLIDQLCHVLVTGRNDRFNALPGGLAGQRTDDVVGLHIRDLQQRQPHGTHQCMQRFDLDGEFLRHRGPVRLVVTVQVVAEGLAAGVKHHGHQRWLVLLDEAAQHIDDTVYRTGRLTTRVR